MKSKTFCTGITYAGQGGNINARAMFEVSLPYQDRDTMAANILSRDGSMIPPPKVDGETDEELRAS